MNGRLVALTAAIAALAGWLGLRLVRAFRPPDVATIDALEDHTVIDGDNAVRSIQAAELTLPTVELERIWSPMHLERLARTYWRFLTRITLGLIEVRYSETDRQVVLVTRPFVMLRFRAPEYEMDAHRGLVRWRIKDGVLVSRRGRDHGYLEIDVRRLGGAGPGHERIRIEVEVANFYPAIASAFSLPVYRATQSRIHVIVTHGFLRSLARLDLAQSRVGRFMRPPDVPPLSVDDVPDPAPEPATQQG